MDRRRALCRASCFWASAMGQKDCIVYLHHRRTAPELVCLSGGRGPGPIKPRHGQELAGIGLIRRRLLPSTPPKAPVP